MKLSAAVIVFLAFALQAVECPVILRTSDYLNPDSGSITVRFQPKWNETTEKLQIAYLFSVRKYLPDQRRLSGPALGINRHTDGRTFLWLYIVHPETKRDWGFYIPYQLKNGESYEITAGWKGSYLYLKAGDKTLADSVMPFRLELAPEINIGGNEKKASGIELISYRIQKPVKREAPLKADPAPSEAKVLLDSEKEFSFEFENPGKKTELSVTPENFAIRKGKRYFLNCAAPELFPQEIIAQADGKLVLNLPPILRTAITISATSGNLLKNSSFESGMNGWKEENNNPGDSAGIDSETFRSGGNSLKLQKNSCGGTLCAMSPEIPVEAGKSYLASGFYHWEKNSLNTALSMSLFISADGKHTVASANNRHELSFPAFQTKAGEWRYAQQSIRVPEKFKGRKLTARIGLRMDGTRGTVYWDDLDFREKPPQAKLKGKVVKASEERLADTGLSEILAKKKPLEASVAIRNGSPVLLINGKQEPFVPFYAQNPEMGGTARRQGTGILVAKVPLNNWEQPTGSIWTGPDQYDFSVLDRCLSRLLSRAPDAKIIVSLYGMAYRNFAKDHPESAWITGGGERGRRFFNNVPELAYSFISDALRSEAGKFMRRLGEHLAGSLYGKAVIGIHFTAGSDGQWYPPLHPWSFKNLDYSEGSRLAVISEIRKQYGNNLAALRNAWKNPGITFEAIRLPSPAELSPERTMLDPGKGDQWLIDTVRAYHKAIIGTIDHLSKEIKAGFGRPVLALTYAPDNALMAKGELCRTQYLDGFICLPSYLRQRAPGGTPFSSGQPHGSIRLHKKLFLEEVDFRNEYSEIPDRERRLWLGMAPGVEGHFAQLRRTFGTLFASGVSGWFMTIGQTGHYTWSGPFAPIIGEVVRAAERQAEGNGMRFPVQVAVFQDNFYQAYFTYRNRLDHFLQHSRTNRNLAYSGLTFMNYLLSDLEHPGRRPAKINYFPTAASLTEKQIQWIEKNLQRDGNILIFSGDAGRFAGRNPEETLRRLTGMKIRSNPEQLVSYTYRTDRIPGANLIGIPGNSLWLQQFRGPLFHVEDPSASTVALLEGSERTGIALKRHPDWTAVYIGGSDERALTVDFWRTLAGIGNITPFGPAGDITCAGNGILMIHAATSGNKVLRWKQNADVTDLATGKAIAGKVNTLTLPMQSGTTRWFALRPVHETD